MLNDLSIDYEVLKLTDEAVSLALEYIKEMLLDNQATMIVCTSQLRQLTTGHISKLELQTYCKYQKDSGIQWD